MFSKRVRWDAPLNRLTLARQSHRGPLLDLTETNPTRAGLPYPHDELADALARGSRVPYDPDPRGLRSARETLASELQCHPDDLIVTASTSEAYSFLFKLLTDPGDDIFTATPSYPLVEYLAALENIELRTFPLEFHRRWEVGEISLTARSRAVAVVNPNNPTGSFVSRSEQDALARLGKPVISDEVFLDYPVESTGSSFVRDDVLTFTLGGLSKYAGLPHFKLAWIRVSGPESAKRQALGSLELIADSFLSVATPVQIALPDLLRIGSEIRGSIRARVRTNLAVLRRELAAVSSASVLPTEGGWSAVIRVPSVMSDEDLALLILGRGVLVQPGFFYDFPSEGFMVVSLLTEGAAFAAGVQRLAEVIPR